LINETSLLVPGILVLTAYGLVIRKSSKPMPQKFIRSLVTFVVLFSILPCLWMLRNSYLPDDAPKGGGRAAAALSHGAYPAFIYKDSKFKYFPYEEDPEQPEFGANYSNFARIWWDRFKQRPLRYISWYLLEKPVYLWNWNNFQSNKGGSNKPWKGDVYMYPVVSSLYLASDIANLSRLFMKTLHPVVLVLALVGLFMCGWDVVAKKGNVANNAAPIFLFVVLVYYTGLYMVFAPYSRYSVPLRPELYICSLWALNEIRERLSALQMTNKISVQK
jgi:hypothetical protein